MVEYQGPKDGVEEREVEQPGRPPDDSLGVMLAIALDGTLLLAVIVVDCGVQVPLEAPREGLHRCCCRACAMRHSAIGQGGAGRQGASTKPLFNTVIFFR